MVGQSTSPCLWGGGRSRWGAQHFALFLSSNVHVVLFFLFSSFFFSWISCGVWSISLTKLFEKFTLGVLCTCCEAPAARFGASMCVSGGFSKLNRPNTTRNPRDNPEKKTRKRRSEEKKERAKFWAVQGRSGARRRSNKRPSTKERSSKGWCEEGGPAGGWFPENKKRKGKHGKREKE